VKGVNGWLVVCFEELFMRDFFNIFSFFYFFEKWMTVLIGVIHCFNFLETYPFCLFLFLNHHFFSPTNLLFDFFLNSFIQLTGTHNIHLHCFLFRNPIHFFPSFPFAFPYDIIEGWFFCCAVSFCCLLIKTI
jgi:hypothetical protein